MAFFGVLMTVLADKDLRKGAAKALQTGANFIADVFDCNKGKTAKALCLNHPVA